MSAIQPARFLPPLQFKFSASAVFVKAPPRGPQTPWPAPRGSHNRTILGRPLEPASELVQCTKINWTRVRWLARKTIFRQNVESGNPLLICLPTERGSAFKMSPLHGNRRLFLVKLDQTCSQGGRISISRQIMAFNLIPHPAQSS